jgi:acetyltransferase-like isoleucine patch superfamily enzyme
MVFTRFGKTKIMKVGKYTYGEKNIEIVMNGANITIGNFCSIAANIKVYLGQNHRTDWISTYPFGHMNKSTFNNFDGIGHPSTKGDIIIGNDVYIGTSAVIMSGVTIGDGAVIGAHSVVTKNVPPYSIFTGNPGSVRKKRFNDTDIEFLLDLKWWDMEDTDINKISPILCSGDIQQLKDYFKK